MKEYPVLKGAEPFYFAGNDVGVLVIHGFTGTTQSMRYVGEKIAASGFTVYGLRLSGHGTNPEDMETRSFEEWLNDVEAGYQKLVKTCSKIVVIGLSMGGTLTLYLAQKYPEIAGIVPINAAIELKGMEEYYEQIRHGKESFVAGIGSDIKQEGVKELAYELTPVKSMGELLKLMELVRDGLSSIHMPAMILSSKVDHVVPPSNSEEIVNTIKSIHKEHIVLENSYHVATLDNDKDLISDKCIEFILNL